MSGLSRRTFLALPTASDLDDYGLIARVVTVSPDLAAEWLAYNIKNRRLKKKLIGIIAAQIDAGAFNLNGEPLIFSSEGGLIDGQNRLHAVIRSGKSVEVLVIHGVEKEFQVSIDTGAQRNLTDSLDMEGKKSTTALSTALKLLHGYGSGTLKTDKTEFVSNKQGLDMSEVFPDLEHSITATRCCRDISSHGVAAGFHYIFSQVDRNKADEFFAAFGTGKGISSGSAIYKLRETLLKKYRDGNGKKSVRKSELRAWIIEAWNAFNLKRKLPKDAFDTFREFPAIHGVPDSFRKQCEKLCRARSAKKQLA